MTLDGTPDTCPDCNSDNIVPLARVGPQDEYACRNCWAVFEYPSGDVTGRVSPEWRAGQWPKSWDDITGHRQMSDRSGSAVPSIGTNMVDLGPVRFYNETVYINPDAVWEGENRDVWMPLGHYLAGWPVGGESDE